MGNFHRRAVSFTKRLMDVVIGLLLLVLTLPLMLVLAIIIKLESKGPALYKEKRVGLVNGPDFDGAIFNYLKFRTMKAEEKSQDYKVTKIGSWMKRTRLEDLPQLFNVITGEMSIVGPRAERPELMTPLGSSIPFFEERMRYVKPGITGLAQINLSYTGELLELPDDSSLANLQKTLINPFHMDTVEGAIVDGMRIKLLYDLAYSAALENFWSFLKTDLSIMLRTPIAMFFHKTKL